MHCIAKTLLTELHLAILVLPFPVLLLQSLPLVVVAIVVAVAVADTVTAATVIGAIGTTTTTTTITTTIIPPPLLPFAHFASPDIANCTSSQASIPLTLMFCPSPSKAVCVPFDATDIALALSELTNEKVTVVV